MKKQLTLIMTSLFFVVGTTSIASAQLKKTYYIKAPTQLTRTDNYSGCGTHYTDWYEQEFGFKWTDDLPAGTTITDLKIEMNVGIAYMDYETSSTLNNHSQGNININSIYYDCEDRTYIVSPASVNTSNYVLGGLNVFKFNAEWGTFYLCKTPALNNSFAKVTVTYAPVISGGPAPDITSLSSNSGLPCSNVTIHGTNFNNSVNHVQFNDVLATSFSVISATELVATIPSDATTGPIRVYTNGGMATSVEDFTITTPPVPEITAISLNSGTVNNTIIITGNHLSCATEVSIGGTAVKSFTVNSASQITATVGYGSSGTIDVTTPGGTGSFGNFTYYEPSSASQMNINGNTGVTNTNANVATTVDPGILISSNGTIRDFTVSISEGYTDGDQLGYDGDLPSGVTTSGFNSNTGVIVFQGAMLATDWQEFLSRVTFRSTSNLCYPKIRKISFIAGNKYFNPLTNHFYEYVPNGVSWEEAKLGAASRSYFGRQGYLATITSQAENNFIWKIMSADAWLGGTDNYLHINEAAGYSVYANQAAAEGKYYWVTGPEKGQQYSHHNAYEEGGVLSISNRYRNWSGGEPNDWPGASASDVGEEDYAQIYSSGSGTWNDLPNGHHLTYIVEYGDMPNDNTSNQVLFSKEINVYGSSAGSITGGNVSVCEGNNSTTLTLTNMTGSVVRWESSFDNFLTPGEAISNSSNTLVVDNINETTYYRAVVNSTSPATCTELASSSAAITVAKSVPGNVNAINNTICEGAEAELTLFGNQGDVLKWQMDTDENFSNPSNINQTTTSLNHTLSNAGAYYFRAQVQNNQCGTPVWSAGKSITVNTGTSPIGGTVSSDEHLAGTLSGTLNLTGNTGNVTGWQYSTDNGLVWVDMNHNSASYDYTNTPGSTTMYRAVVSNAGCGSAYSNPGMVRIYGNNQYVWKGTVNNESNNTDNWLEAGMPLSSSDVIISSTAQNNMSLQQNLQLNLVDFNGSDRKIVLGNYDLTLNEISGADAENFFQTNGTGSIRKNISTSGSFTFPVGNTSYNPVVITNNSGSADEFRVKVRNEVLQAGTSGNQVSAAHIKRTWDIDKALPNGGAGINFTFNWNNGETTGILTSPFLFHYGTNWEKQTGTTMITSNSLSYTGYTGTFSPFAIIDGASTLPVTWLNFSAKRQQNSVVLQWQTASEQNSKDFLVQHQSGNGIWRTIGTVIAAGNSDVVQSYTFTHHQPVAGANFYRILQRDNDGKESFSKTVSISVNEATARISVYPTAVTSGMVNVQLPVAEQIFLFNGIGSMVLSQNGVSGLNTISVGHLGRGIYYLRAGNETVKILIQ